MISKNRIKLIHSLDKKKFRNDTGLFVAEGHKLVGELLDAEWNPTYIAAEQRWAQQHAQAMGQTEHDIVSTDELARASLLQHPQQVLALFRIPTHPASLDAVARNELCLALDGVQDPGNMGTIVRLADWFGIGHIFCSPDTVDVFNPKAVQATMGAISRVQVHYTDLVQQLAQADATIYGTHLDGANIYDQPLGHTGVIVMGNEGKGVSEAVSAHVNQRLYIPPYPADNHTVESLNVAIATAIVCAEFRRRG